jgi:hypothetical protein
MSPILKTPIDMHRTHARPARRTAWLFLAIATLCTAAACSNLLDVKAPDAIDAGSLENPVNADLLVFSSIGDFDCAYATYVVTSGLMSGEFIETTLTASRWSYDRRDIDPNETQYSINSCESLGTYTPIQTARYTADHALGLLEGWTDAQVPDRTELIAQSAAYAGYSRILLGEGFCTAAIAGGPQLTSDQIFALAVQKFDTAITAAQSIGDDSTRNLALVGRARAELDGGNNAAALVDASAVPADFVYYATFNSNPDHRANRVYVENNADNGVSVTPLYRSYNDPRVPTDSTGTLGSDHDTHMIVQLKYHDGSTSIPIASGREAQLIVAEATGGSAAIGILNSARADIGLPPLASSSDPAVVQGDIASERAKWLWLQGTHLYDVRRFTLPLYPAAGLPYSITSHKAGSYGTETCMPIPAAETNNNPNARNPPVG